ncbi:MAG: hypothetical protein ACTHMV_15095 [Chitinophagaceae bacterium]
MSLLKAIGIIILCYLIPAIVIDIAGVLLVTILPGPGSRRLNGNAGFGSTALYYVVWVTAGCLAGFFFTVYSREATRASIAIQRRPILIFIIGLLLSAGLLLLFYATGEMNGSWISLGNNYYVPGHRNVTYIFFISLLLVSLLLLKMEKRMTGPEEY